jgi:rhodanese-related sulfurtransferase
MLRLFQRNYSRVSAHELASLVLANKNLVVIDVRAPAERVGMASVPTAVSFPVRKRVEEVAEALAKARVAALAKKSGKGKKAADAAAAANAAVTQFDASTVPRADHFATIATADPDKFQSRYGFARPQLTDHVVFVATGTTRSAELAESAEKHGYTNVSILEGGMRSWTKHWSLGYQAQSQQQQQPSQQQQQKQ